jgi:hypothetical protein
MKQDIENIIKKNLPEEKIISNIKFNSIQEDYSSGLLEGEILGHNQCLSQINTSFIADEVLKVFREQIEDLPTLYNSIEHLISKDDILDLLDNLSPNKENE